MDLSSLSTYQASCMSLSLYFICLYKTSSIHFKQIFFLPFIDLFIWCGFPLLPPYCWSAAAFLISLYNVQGQWVCFYSQCGTKKKWSSAQLVVYFLVSVAGLLLWLLDSRSFPCTVVVWYKVGVKLNCTRLRLMTVDSWLVINYSNDRLTGQIVNCTTRTRAHNW